MRIAVADIGGTHARFALADIAETAAVALGEVITLKTAEHASLQTAWAEFGKRTAGTLPRSVAIAVACPVAGEVLKLTNNPWTIAPALIADQLAVDRVTLVNDFGAVGHAISRMGEGELRKLCGPDRPLGEDEVISIVGPGTGLGVAYVVRRQGRNVVVESEGGHIDFAPLDPLEDAILQHLRRRYRRVSVERIVSGPGLTNLYEAIAAIEGRAVQPIDDKGLWALALSGSDSLASAALDRFCLCLGSVAGDITLAQGGTAVVIAGGLGLKLAEHLPRSAFSQRFAAKGRFEALMSALPVKIVTHPQPGLYGAAVAFAEEHLRGGA